MMCPLCLLNHHVLHVVVLVNGRAHRARILLEVSEHLDPHHNRHLLETVLLLDFHRSLNNVFKYRGELCGRDLAIRWVSPNAFNPFLRMPLQPDPSERLLPQVSVQHHEVEACHDE